MPAVGMEAQNTAGPVPLAHPGAPEQPAPHVGRRRAFHPPLRPLPGYAFRMDVAVSFRVREAGTTLTRTVMVPPGTLLLEAARRLGLPLARACGGGGLCGRCGLAVLEGTEALSPESGAEAASRRRNRVPEGLRLACRTRALGAVTATAAYW